MTMTMMMTMTMTMTMTMATIREDDDDDDDDDDATRTRMGDGDGGSGRRPGRKRPQEPNQAGPRSQQPREREGGREGEGREFWRLDEARRPCGTNPARTPLPLCCYRRLTCMTRLFMLAIASLKCICVGVCSASFDMRVRRRARHRLVKTLHEARRAVHPTDDQQHVTTASRALPFTLSPLEST
eukprot:3918246-Rhodomonas_salina.1